MLRPPPGGSNRWFLSVFWSYFNSPSGHYQWSHFLDLNRLFLRVFSFSFAYCLQSIFSSFLKKNHGCCIMFCYVLPRGGSNRWFLSAFWSYFNPPSVHYQWSHFFDLNRLFLRVFSCSFAYCSRSIFSFFFKPKSWALYHVLLRPPTGGSTPWV